MLEIMGISFIVSFFLILSWFYNQRFLHVYNFQTLIKSTCQVDMAYSSMQFVCIAALIHKKSWRSICHEFREMRWCNQFKKTWCRFTSADKNLKFRTSLSLLVMQLWKSRGSRKRDPRKENLLYNYDELIRKCYC